MNAQICPHCQRQNQAGAARCFACGRPMPAAGAQPPPTGGGPIPPPAGGRICPSCGAALRATARFCNHCGHALPLPPTPPAQPPQRPPARRGAPQPRFRLNLLALFLGVGFVVFLCLSISLLVIGDRLGDPEAYKQALRESGFYEQFADLLVDQMVHSQPNTLRVEDLTCIQVNAFTPDDWRALANSLAPPAWLQAQTEALIDQVFAFLDSETEELTLTLSLAHARSVFSGEQGYQLYQGVAASKEVCSLIDIANIAQWIFDPQALCLPVCRVPIGVNENTWQIVQAFATLMPDTYSLGSPWIDAAPLVAARSLRDALRTLQLCACLFTVFPFLLLLLSLWRSPTWSARWLHLGLVLLAGSGFSLLLGLALFMSARVAFPGLPVDLAPTVAAALGDISAALLDPAALMMLIPAAVMFVLGAVFMLLGFISRR